MSGDAADYTNLSSSGQHAALAPFAGREAARAYLYQRLTDTQHRHGITIVGARGSGKSALLANFDSFFDEAFISVMLPLKAMTQLDEVTLLVEMTRRAALPMVQRQFSLERIPPAPESDTTLRAWFEDDYLPIVSAIIRPHRRLVFLLDDVDVLIDAIADQQLPQDFINFLQRMLAQFEQLQLVVTIDTSREAELDKLSPLVNPTDTFRLGHLTAEATAKLLRLREGEEAAYKITDEAIRMVYAATGGEPQITQRMNAKLYECYRNGRFTLTADDVRAITPHVYAAHEADFRHSWEQMSRNEHLVLVALTSLIYDNPLKAVTDDAIADWLIESDYLLDRTAVKAALRSLEYREVVHNDNGLKITASLMQKWLMENAQVKEAAAPQHDTLLMNSRWMLPAIILVVLLVIALILVITGSDASPVNDAAPTVTLAP